MLLFHEVDEGYCTTQILSLNGKAIAQTSYGFKDGSGKKIEDPDWTINNKVHEWRNHVPEELKEAWPFMSQTERMLVYLLAAKAASEEDWD